METLQLEIQGPMAMGPFFYGLVAFSDIGGPFWARVYIYFKEWKYRACMNEIMCLERN